jgi:hypothetical protein
MPPADILKPKTIKFVDAMARLSMGRTTLRRLLARDVFSVLAPRGRGPGKPLYLRTDEVELYDETRSEDAVRNLRARAKRLKRKAA